jgi:translation initiation factor 1
MSNSDLVYSTDGGDRRGARGERRLPAQAPPGVPNDGVVRVGREKSGRKGKTVTVVTGVGGRPDDLRAVATELKRLCGTGGAVKDGQIEIQGDHRERVAERLRALGHRVKLTGG